MRLVHGSPTHGVVWCDGHRSTEFRSGMEIEVVQGRHRLRLARLSESPFTNRLVNKFRLPVDGWRGQRRTGTAAGSPPISARLVPSEWPTGVIERTADRRPGRDRGRGAGARPRPDRGHRRDRGRQDHDRQRSGAAARRAGRPQDRTGRRGAGAGRGAVPSSAATPARSRGGQVLELGGVLEDDELLVARQVTSGRTLPRLRRWRPGARRDLRRDRQPAGHDPRPVRAAPAGRPGSAAGDARSVRRSRAVGAGWRRTGAAYAEHRDGRSPSWRGCRPRSGNGSGRSTCSRSAWRRSSGSPRSPGEDIALAAEAAPAAVGRRSGRRRRATPRRRWPGDDDEAGGALAAIAAARASAERLAAVDPARQAAGGPGGRGRLSAHRGHR